MSLFHRKQNSLGIKECYPDNPLFKKSGFSRILLDFEIQILK